MTFSIVARSLSGSSWGVAVASRFLAGGAAVPAARAGVGAVATQALANLSYRPEGLRLLTEGGTAQEVLDALIGADEGRPSRQIGIVDRLGGSATFTGGSCHAWAGGRNGPGFAIQGNILTGPEVVDHMVETFTSEQAPNRFAERLMAALRAGDEAGGDRRGRQSASILVVRADAGYDGHSDVEVDLRVDDHARPIDELDRLLTMHRLYFSPPDPATLIPLKGKVAGEVSGRLATLGYGGPVERALRDWAEAENYEMRLVGGHIDPLVLDRLRRASA